MIKLSTIIVLLALFSSCDDGSEQVIPADEAPAREKQTHSDNWMEGGEALYDATVAKWRKASSDEKLATSADYIKNSDSIPAKKLMREHAEALLRCIDESVDGMATMSDDPVTEVAASCLSSMGLLEENDPEKLRATLSVE